MLKSWYQETAQLLVNKQQYELLNTPLIAALGALKSKMKGRNCVYTGNLSKFDKHDLAQFLAKF